jgi:hypothetical protein
MAKLGRDGTAGSSTGGSRASMTAGKAKTTIVRPKPKAASAETIKIQKSSVKKLPVKTATAPKTGLENRGARLTDLQKKNRAADLSFNKAEKRYEANTEMYNLGGKTGKPTFSPSAKNVRKEAAIDKEAAKKVAIKINSARLKRNRTIK